MGGANPGVWAKNLLFEKIFAENCMKMKEIEPRGAGRFPGAPSLSSANALNVNRDHCKVVSE